MLGRLFEVVVKKLLQLPKNTKKYTSIGGTGVIPDFVTAAAVFSINIVYFRGIPIVVPQYLRGEELTFIDAKMQTTPIKLSDPQTEGMIDVLKSNKDKVKGNPQLKKLLTPILAYVTNSDAVIQDAVIMYGTQNNVLIAQSIAEWECKQGIYWIRLGELTYKNEKQMADRAIKAGAKKVSFVIDIWHQTPVELPKRP